VYLPLDNTLLNKLLWHASINLRSSVIEYLLFNTNLKETITKEEIQKILFRIGKKFHVSEILQKELPINYTVGEDPIQEERQCDLTTTIRLLHSKIPLRIDQQRMLGQFPKTEEGIEKLTQIANFIKLARDIANGKR